MKKTIARIEVIVTYEAIIEIPEGRNPEKYMRDNWEDYEDELLPQDTERSLIETWEEDDE